MQSVVMRYGESQWPNIVPTQPLNPSWTLLMEQAAIRDFMRSVEAAKQFDRSARQADCEDPEKTKLLGRIAERLDVIERALGI